MILKRSDSCRARCRDKEERMLEMEFNGQKEILDSWWFFTSEWPPADFDYSEKLKSRRFRCVDLESFNNEPETDSQEAIPCDRKLATIRSALEVSPIPGADSIQAITIDGWVCVAKKDEFKPGDKGVYFEIDSFLPASDSRFSFLSKQFIAFNNILGARLHTIRLRGQLSQGLFLPISLFPELEGKDLGDDVTRELNIIKWEPPGALADAGNAPFGNFPNFIVKTDQPRVQNLLRELEENVGKEFEVTIKLDGCRMTIYKKDDKKGVCSRNIELKEGGGNYWKVVNQCGILEALELLKRNLAFQGELLGEGIQGNNEKLKVQEFYLFDIFDIDNQKYLGPIERKGILKTLEENGFKIKHVPVLDNLVLKHTVKELVEMADGFSLNPKQKREGLVFKRLDGLFSFKSISNAYLEKNKDR